MLGTCVSSRLWRAGSLNLEQGATSTLQLFIMRKGQSVQPGNTICMIKSGYKEEEEERKKFCLNQEEEDNGVVKRIRSPHN